MRKIEKFSSQNSCRQKTETKNKETEEELETEIDIEIEIPEILPVSKF